MPAYRKAAEGRVQHLPPKADPATFFIPPVLRLYLAMNYPLEYCYSIQEKRS